MAIEKNTEAFEKLDDSFCVLWARSYLKQVALYARRHEGGANRRLYAKHGGGFLAIYSNGTTANQDVQCRGINCAGVIWKDDGYGFLEIQNGSE